MYTYIHTLLHGPIHKAAGGRNRNMQTKQTHSNYTSISNCYSYCGGKNIYFVCVRKKVRERDWLKKQYREKTKVDKQEIKERRKDSKLSDHLSVVYQEDWLICVGLVFSSKKVNPNVGI